MATTASNALRPTGIPRTARSIPPGLSSILTACQRLYPTQLNPLQASPIVKFWLGGPDPLDYISMYLNAGNETKGIPEHWHYISFGLSDLYGDGRIHPVELNEDENDEEKPLQESVSGFGFELTFRLKRAAGELTPPLWPSDFLQDLARYIFSTNNSFVPGDHVSWHRSLDAEESRIQHVIMAEDPQMAMASSTSLTFKKVQFVQVVGVCKEELEAAQHWNGRGVLELLRSCKNACGMFCNQLWSLNFHEFFAQRSIGDNLTSKGSN
jgi:suppressor of fused